MTITHTNKEIIKQQCHHLSKTVTNAHTTWTIFGNSAVKKLLISVFIDMYNHFINRVDLTDQL